MLKKDCKKVAAALQRPRQLAKCRVKVNRRALGVLYVKPSHETVPEWLSFLDLTVDDLSARLVNASTAAVLLVRASKRLFALTFGHGRTLLQPDVVEENFGLRITLNSVDPNKIRTVDRLTFDAISQHTRIQASREASIGEFGLDVEQDLLRAVTGRPTNSSLGTRLTGKDALHANAPVTLSTLRKLLSLYLEESEKQTYKENFPWVDQLNEVGNKQLQAQLDTILLSHIQNAEYDRLWLSVPDIIDWSSLTGFKYHDSSRAPLHDDLHIKDFVDELRDITTLDVAALKRAHFVHAIDANTNTTVERWPVYRCLYTELQHRNQTYFLNGGKWYRVEQDFLTRVNQSIANIGDEGVTLPAFHDNSEGEYNDRIAAQDTHFALMDKRLIQSRGIANRVEFCDLYADDKKMIHVKRYAASAPLSHLFAQGLVSGELFARDEEFRQAVTNELPTHFRATISNPRPQEYAVVYGVISKSQRPLELPFFSRINLRNAHRRLTGLGYRVGLTKIPTATST